MFLFPITADFHTQAPPRAVWAAFQAVERWPEVIPDLVGAAIEPPGPLAAGSVIHASAGPVGAAVDIEYRVTLAEEPHRLPLESDTLDWNGRTEYTIEPPKHFLAVDWKELWAYRDLFLVLAWRDTQDHPGLSLRRRGRP